MPFGRFFLDVPCGNPVHMHLTMAPSLLKTIHLSVAFLGSQTVSARMMHSVRTPSSPTR